MNILKRFIERILFLFPLKNIIIFESLPDFSDNTRAVFDEMVKRGLNKTYQLVWTTHGEPVLPEELAAIPNVKAVQMDSAIYKYYYSYFAKALLVSNFFMQRRRQKQYYIYLAHGAAFKGIKDRRYSVPKDCYGCDFSVYSDYIGRYDIRNLNADESMVRMVELGFARNDALFSQPKDIPSVFAEHSFEHMIYWLPTFRKKEDSDYTYSSISVPFIEKPAYAAKINQVAKDNQTLLVIKPHPAQDLSAIHNIHLSNILFIDNAFLTEHHISNYELLAASDALLSDYSSVFYDYLLCDKPIGFCWEDFEEYSQKEGFIDIYEEIIRCAELLYSCDDLCDFITAVANNEDTKREEREEIRSKIHKYCDNRAAARTVDHILKHIS